jgi:hypothetical protein
MNYISLRVRFRDSATSSLDIPQDTLWEREKIKPALRILQLKRAIEQPTPRACKHRDLTLGNNFHKRNVDATNAEQQLVVGTGAIA